jgi:hypothetical protein
VGQLFDQLSSQPCLIWNRCVQKNNVAVLVLNGTKGILQVSTRSYPERALSIRNIDEMPEKEVPLCEDVHLKATG